MKVMKELNTGTSITLAQGISQQIQIRHTALYPFAIELYCYDESLLRDAVVINKHCNEVKIQTCNIIHLKHI